MKHLILSIFCFVAATTLYGATDSQFSVASYLRTQVLNDSTLWRLDVGARHFISPDSQKSDIWLVGAIHVASRDYYRNLQTLLDSCDCVLFECASEVDFLIDSTQMSPNEIDSEILKRIAILRGFVSDYTAIHHAFPQSLRQIHRSMLRRGATVELRSLKQIMNDVEYPLHITFTPESITLWMGPFFSTINKNNLDPYDDNANLQQKFAHALDLKFQLNEIRYDRPHFIHADMTMEDLYRTAREKNLDSATLQAAEGLLHGSGLGEFLVSSFIHLMTQSNQSKLMMKCVLVEALSMQMEADSTLGMGQSLARLILYERNNKVVDELMKQLNRKHTVAVFYGAAHLDDIERRLLALGFVPQETRWFTAIEADIKNSGITHLQIEQIRNSIIRRQKKATKP